MYNKYRFHVLKPSLEVCFVVLKNREQRKGEKCEWVGLGWTVGLCWAVLDCVGLCWDWVAKALVVSEVTDL